MELFASSTMALLHSSSTFLINQQLECTSLHGALERFPPSLVRGRNVLKSSESWEKNRAGSLTSIVSVENWEQRRQKRRKWRIACSMAEDGTSSSKRGREPLKVMISGAPASGKGTQCELIVEKFGLSHISTGDLLRAEVAAWSKSGKIAKAYMDSGKLVPNEIMLALVEKNLGVSERGWLLDGYPQSLEQAEALEAMSVRPQIFILLDVPDVVLVERVAGRRVDPVTGKIYHLKYSPPATAEIANRLTQRFADTDEKAKIRLAAYHAKVESVMGVYEDIVKRVDGNRPKKDVFADIAKLLVKLEGEDEGEVIKNSSEVMHGIASPAVSPTVKAQQQGAAVKGLATAVKKGNWTGVPTKLNTTPHSREIREYFYADVCKATKKAVEDGIHKLRVQVTIPELNPEMDVFRIGTLLEIIREIAFAFANDGKRVRVCVQGSMGEGIFSGMPLQLAGTRQLLDRMDWGEYGAKGTFINIGAVGAKEVKPEDDMFILLAPQNAVGNCIIDDLRAMVAAAGDRPLIIVNPRLKDLPGSGGVMQVLGREKRLEFVGSFFTCYHFRLLYQSGSHYPILGALRMAYPSPYQIYKRFDTDTKSKEEYVLLPDTFKTEPSRSEISDAYYGRSPKKTPEGIWAFFNRVLN